MKRVFGPSTFVGCAIGAFVTMSVFTSWSFEGWRIFLVNYFWNLMIWLSQWIGCRVVAICIDQKFDWEKQPVKKLISFLTLIPVYAVSAFYLVAFIMFKIGFNWSWSDTWTNLKAINAYGITIPIALMLTLIYTAIDFYKHWQESKLEAERLRTEMMTYKYEALRNQLNPHFLFNTLASVNSLIDLDPALAKNYIAKLSSIFRYVLEIQDNEKIALNREWEFAKEYAFLTSSRSNGGLKYEFDKIEIEEGEFLLPMSVQLLLENVAKHNRYDADEPLITKIFREGNYIVVKNEKRVRQNLQSTKIGLNNIKSRYAHLTGQVVKVIDDNSHFMVKLPIIK